MIISNDYIKKSKFGIYIDDKLIQYSKAYKFSKIGNYIIKFELYEDISLDNMFKDITALVSIDFQSDKNLKILSMGSTFENCKNLNIFDIKGFNTEKVQSLKKLFYGTKISSLSLEQFNTINVKDMSFMMAESDISSFNFSLFDTSNVVNMSYMFYNCESLANIDIEKINMTKVEDMSYMFAKSESLIYLNFREADTSHVKDMSHLFSNCNSLISLDIPWMYHFKLS